MKIPSTFRSNPSIALCRGLPALVALTVLSVPSLAQVRGTRLTVPYLTARYGVSVALRCNLSYWSGTAYRPLAGKPVMFYINNGAIGVGYTDSSGNAYKTISTTPFGVGNKVVRCYYAGQAGYYGDSSAWNYLQIYR